MKILLRSFLIAFILSASVANAGVQRCETLFESDVESLLEKAGQAELNLKNFILQSKTPAQIQAATKQLVELQKLIDDILTNFDGSALAAENVLNQLDHLAKIDTRIQKTDENNREVLRPTRIEQTKLALKDLEGLQPYLKEKFRLFLDEVSQVHSLAELSPSWALERIHLLEITKEDTYSVRLNRGYRVIFIYYPATGLKILRLSMTVSH